VTSGTTGGLRPVIFDMDGVLVDSEPLYQRAFDAYVNGIGRPEMAAWYPNTLGRRQADFVPQLAHDLGGRDAGEVMEGLRAGLARELQRDLAAMPGVPDAVLRIAAGRPVGLATSSRRPFADRVLATLGLESVFGDAVATGEEVARGKPDPELYLLAAARLGADPGRSIAIEDTPAGVRAAVAAGMTAIAIPNEHTRGLDFGRAATVVADLDAAAELVARLDDA
jgi:HAD superfamily hydrolase (TIGR01509 family)